MSQSETNTLPGLVLGVCLTLLLLPLPLLAAVAPAPIFGDHAVLQAGDDTPVWGAAREGEAVTVSIGAVTASTVTTNGRWQVRLKGLKPSTTAQDLVVKGDNTVTIKDVLIGEVWLCTGQSNMARTLGLWPGQPPIDNWEQEAAAANNPSIRYYSGKGWMIITPESVLKCSAVAWFFADALYKVRPGAMGLICNAQGSTFAQDWTSREGLAAVPALAHVLNNFDAKEAAYREALAKFKTEEPALMAAWEKETATAKSEGKPRPPRPKAPSLQTVTTQCFKSHILPIIPVGLRGVLWYQGENNSRNPQEYELLLPAMMADWRTRWNRPDLPFLIVQLPSWSGFRPEFREAQQHIAGSVPGVGIVTTLDVGDSGNVHPAHKKPVGERLALLARKQVYGENIVASGPRFAGVKFEGPKAVVSFTELGGGLVIKGDKLKGFALVKGVGGKSVDATATVVGDTVEVTAPGVEKPVAVTYGWANVSDANLANKAGLPAFPFRSHDQATLDKRLP